MRTLRRCASSRAAATLAILWLLAAGCPKSGPEPGSAPPTPETPAATTPAPPAAPELAGGAWTIETVGARPVLDPAATEIRFAANGDVRGSTGCNRFTGKAAIEGTSVRFGPMASTRRACPPPQMEQETRVLEALAAVRTVATAGMGRVRLLDADGLARIELRRANP